MRVGSLLEKYPELARAFDLYLSCRSLQLFHLKTTKNKRVTQKVVPFVTGYHSLPEQGGMLDQPHRLMSLFERFRDGENQAAMKKLNK